MEFLEVLGNVIGDLLYAFIEGGVMISDWRKKKK